MSSQLPDPGIRQIVNAIPACVAYINRNLTAIFLNDAYADWFGVAKAQIEGRHMRDVVGEESFQLALPHVQAALNGERCNHQRSLRRPNGEVRHVQASYVPHKVAGQVVGLFTLLSDVTDLKATQEDLSQARKRSDQLVAERTRELHAEIATREFSNRLLEMDRAVLQMVARDEPLSQIFLTLAHTLELLSENASCSLHTLSADGRTLTETTAPSLPPPRAGSKRLDIRKDPACCTAAVAQAVPIICSDWETRQGKEAQLWTSRGVRASYAAPIISSSGRVHGVLALHYLAAKSPSARDTALLSHAAELALIAMEHQQAEDQLRYLASHDPLTGLLNRTMFHQRLKHAVTVGERQQKLCAVMYIDLDRFKGINDSLGHECGDLLLKKVAAALTAQVRRADTVGRLGGDEFAILLESLTHPEEAELVAQKVVKALSHPMVVHGKEITITCSVGISLFPDHGKTGDLLLSNADLAMYAAKHRGKNQAQIFKPDMNLAMKDWAHFENDLALAVQRGELVVHFQPRVEMGNRHIKSVEALVRWQHRDEGLILPERFIPLAEDTGLIGSIGEWVLAEACRQIKELDRKGQQLDVSVNVSPVQLCDPGFADRVACILEEAQFPASRLELELTEQVLIRRDPVTLSSLERLKAMGVHLAIDDFGTGYSSLGYLRHFPIDTVKIDQSFIRDLAADPTAAAIVNAVLALGQQLELRIVAEGVEGMEQERYLIDQGCLDAQGHLFSAALPADQLGELLMRSAAAEQRAAASLH